MLKYAYSVKDRIDYVEESREGNLPYWRNKIRPVRKISQNTSGDEVCGELCCCLFNVLDFSASLLFRG